MSISLDQKGKIGPLKCSPKKPEALNLQSVLQDNSEERWEWKIGKKLMITKYFYFIDSAVKLLRSMNFHFEKVKKNILKCQKLKTGFPIGVQLGNEFFKFVDLKLHYHLIHASWPALAADGHWGEGRGQGRWSRSMDACRWFVCCLEDFLEIREFFFFVAEYSLNTWEDHFEDAELVLWLTTVVWVRFGRVGLWSGGCFLVVLGETDQLRKNLDEIVFK